MVAISGNFTSPVWFNGEGTPCFGGTLVPVRFLLDHLERGFTLYDFLMAFPAVRRDQVIAFLELAAGQFMGSAPH